MNPNRITTTVGLNIGKIDVDGVRLNFWDLGGQQELQSLWDKVCTHLDTHWYSDSVECPKYKFRI